MDAIQLLVISVVLYLLSSIVALAWRRPLQIARLIAGLISLLASLVGVASAGLALAAATSPALLLFQIQPFGWFQLQMDGLSAVLVGIITLVGAGTSLYAISSPQNRSLVGFFTGVFMGAMLVVVTVSNGFFFLVCWELMTLVSYFLVTWKSGEDESARTGYLYMLVAHAGAALIMLAFLIFFLKADSFDFRLWRQVWLSPGLKNLVFLLIFVGFGAKAGMVPLHFWTPGTYRAAPDHVSALMAGVMKKTAIYGILRIGVDLLGVTSWWWGFLVLVFGVASTVLGAFYALAERDLKRLLAYSSVENVGIILMGVGLGMLGLAVQQPVLTVLGFLAALYHMLNHTFFKGLLFLGAGCAIDQSGTTDLNRMGGLARRMPGTAFAFLVGALAITAIPPFNGFVSEWFTYQAFFTASRTSFFALRVISPLSAVLLAFAGAFAVMVYIKAYGGAFTGPARSQAAASALEAPTGMQAGMLYMVLGCLALGLGAPIVAPWIAGVAASFARVPPVAVSNGWQIFPAEASQAVLSPPAVMLLLAGMLVAPFAIAALYAGTRLKARSGVPPWTCGYGYEKNMSVAPSSFDQPVRVSFYPLYWVRTLVEKPFRAIRDFSRSALGTILRAEPMVENAVTLPTTRLVKTAGQLIQALQMGDIRVYCLYIILTLAILLIAILGGSGL